MALKMALWLFALLFIATLWNVVTAYQALGEADVSARFVEMGILGGTRAAAEFPLPVRKPSMMQDIALSE